MDNINEQRKPAEAESLSDVDKKFWSMIRDADQKLRRKFGSSLTSWVPTPDNSHLLDEASYRAKMKEWDRVGHERSVAHTNFENKEIAYNTTGFENNLVDFRFYAAHEMLHAHTLNAFAAIDFSKLPDLYELEEEDSRKMWGNAVLEVVVDHLAIKALKLEEKDIDKLPIPLLKRMVDTFPFLEILAPLKNVDQELLKMVKGQEPTELVSDMDRFYGKDFYYSKFMPAVFSTAATQRLGAGLEAEIAGKKYIMSVCEEAIKKKGRYSFLGRKDFEKALDIYRQNLDVPNTQN